MNPPWPSHRDNAPGDFYVEDGCCTSCGVPETEAPEVFGWAKSDPGNCVVARQPETPESVGRTISAMLNSEVDCIRYRGADPDIARRLVEAGAAALCDLPPPEDAKPLQRTYAGFTEIGGSSSLTARQLAQAFSDYFVGSARHELQDYKAKRIWSWGRHASVKISWYQDRFHTVIFKAVAKGEWLAATRPHGDAWIGLSRTLDNWLRTDGQFTDIRWYSAEQWRAGGPFRRTVI